MSREHGYFVYLITNQIRTVLYIGVTNDLARRLEQHRRGEVKGFTQQYKAAYLVYVECYPDIRDAIVREKQLKSWTRRKKDSLVATMNPKWADISSDFVG